jgi:uncharacterized membrane protein YraQ (UPF0718 family)
MLQEFARLIIYSLFGMQQELRLADAMEFFIYNVIMIFLLLSVIIFAVSVVRSHFPPEKTKRILSHKKEFIGNIFAAILGVVTPFCSCKAVPPFIRFVEAGVPLGVTSSFLIASPANAVTITDVGDIDRHGILSMPGLIVNGKIKRSGKPLPSLEKVKELIKGEA